MTRVLGEAGETIHPASRHLANESAHFTSESAGHDLHCFQAWRRMDELLVANFMVLHDVLEDEHYDLIVADEAWEADHFLHENPELKRGAFAWLTDFVGWLPTDDAPAAEAALTADYNAEMLEHVARYPWIRDRALFVGNPDDVVPHDFGPDLPAIRDWTEQHFEFPGYITGFDSQHAATSSRSEPTSASNRPSGSALRPSVVRESARPCCGLSSTPSQRPSRSYPSSGCSSSPGPGSTPTRSGPYPTASR